jgi:hypothetical protein
MLALKRAATRAVLTPGASGAAISHRVLAAGVWTTQRVHPVAG